ncbi:MAG TPA: LysR family transcriptional regulator [Solirubrobacteraceae bacterium]|nr:LysR family transcriptional regulator [Solirubrobacteraceae bacterium]
MPELRELRAFIAVAEQLSFTRAAETLHLSQQTVSKTIRELERELGVELLERTTREVRVTPAGAALLEPGRRVLSLAESAFDEARAVGTGRSGTIRIGVSPAVGPTDRAEVIRALRAAQPEVSISLRVLRPGQLRDSLRARAVDFVLTRASGVEDASVHHAELRPTPMDICVRIGHPLSGQTSLRLAQITGVRVLTASAPGTPYTDMLLARFAEAGAAVTAVEARVTGGAELLTELALKRDAVAIMPTGTSTPADVVSIPIEDLALPLLVLWPAGLPPRSVVRLGQAMAAGAGQL